MVKQAIVWLRAFFRWLTSEFRLVWRALLVVVLPFLVVRFLTGASEFQFRFIGLGLQLFGLGTVIYGVEETRKLFGHPSLPQLLREKVSRIPRSRLHAVVIGDVMQAFDAAAVYRKEPEWKDVDPAAPIQEQVNALKKNVESLKQQLSDMHGEIDSKLHRHSESLHKEQESRKQGDEHLHLRIEAAETGGLHISLMGVFWLAMGLLLTTFSPEIALWAM